MHAPSTFGMLPDGASRCCSQVVSVDELGQGIRLYGKGAPRPQHVLCAWPWGRVGSGQAQPSH